MHASENGVVVLDDPATSVMENERDVARTVFSAYELPDTLATFIGRFIHPNDGDAPAFVELVENHAAGIVHAEGLGILCRDESIVEAQWRAREIAQWARKGVWPLTWSRLQYNVAQWRDGFCPERELREQWQHNHVNKLCYLADLADSVSHKVTEAVRLTTEQVDVSLLRTSADISCARENTLLAVAYAADSFLEACRLGVVFDSLTLMRIVQHVCKPSSGERR